MGTLVAIAYSEAALASLRNVQPKKVRKQIAKKIAALADNPKPPGSCKVQSMGNGTDEVYRVRSGDYRALYALRRSEVVVLDIGHRKDVYRNR